MCDSDDMLANLRSAMDQVGEMSRLVVEFMAQYRRNLLSAGIPEDEAANLTADLHVLWWEKQLGVGH